jgi:hypothetical protein
LQINLHYECPFILSKGEPVMYTREVRRSSYKLQVKVRDPRNERFQQWLHFHRCAASWDVPGGRREHLSQLILI